MKILSYFSQGWFEIYYYLLVCRIRVLALYFIPDTILYQNYPETQKKNVDLYF